MKLIATSRLPPTGFLTSSFRRSRQNDAEGESAWILASRQNDAEGEGTWMLASHQNDGEGEGAWRLASHQNDERGHVEERARPPCRHSGQPQGDVIQNPGQVLTQSGQAGIQAPLEPWSFQRCFRAPDMPPASRS
jgi:hypothetical protein